MGTKTHNIRLMGRVILFVRSVATFVIYYLVSFAVGIGILLLCIHWMKLNFEGRSIPVTKPLLVIFLMASVLLLYKMIGALTAFHKVRRTDLMEISEDSYPELFAMIHRVTGYMHLAMPRKVFLSATVSASVFLDGGWLGCLFPYKKNLEIGLGLLNVLNNKELEAVLAHEFGHFSQQSMALNGPLYSINQFVAYMRRAIVVKKRGTFESQYYILSYLFILLLEIFFRRLRRSYRRLSDELEFDADSIARQYVGTEALVSALYKVTFAASTFDDTCRRAVLLTVSDRRLDNLYTAHRIANKVVTGLAHVEWDSAYLHEPVPGYVLSSLNRRRVERLLESCPTDADGVREGAIDLSPAREFVHQLEIIGEDFTADFYRTHTGCPSGKKSLEVVSAAWYRLWCIHIVLVEEERREQQAEVVIAMGRHLHRMPLTDWHFGLFVDDQHIGEGWYKKGFAYTLHLDEGEHRLSMQGEYVSADSFATFTVSNHTSYHIDIDYEYRWGKEYHFFIKEKRVSEEVSSISH
jgi:Zn-dependent protease with chaperone function